MLSADPGRVQYRCHRCGRTDGVDGHPCNLKQDADLGTTVGRLLLDGHAQAELLEAPRLTSCASTVLYCTVPLCRPTMRATCGRQLSPAAFGFIASPVIHYGPRRWLCAPVCSFARLVGASSP
nr:hypothetical protein CFP56_16679 [Quercus suber]